MTDTVLCGFKDKDRPPKQAILRLKLKVKPCQKSRLQTGNLNFVYSCCHKILVAY